MDLNDKVEPTITKEQIDQWQQQRVQACAQQIQAILQQYDCALVAIPRIGDDGRLTAVARIEAK